MVTSRWFPTDRALWSICLIALILRIGVLIAFVEFPGVADPNHYYNVGVRIANGLGFTTDAIWQFNDEYAAIEHPDDYWMPLTAYLAGGSMALFGVSVTSALIPFVIVGSLLPLIAYDAARQIGVGRGGQLFAAACAACLPELVLNSVRTETTVLAAFTTGAALLCFTRGMRGGRIGWFIAAGIMTGLAYLTRSEAVLIVVAVAIAAAVYGLARQRIPRAVVVMPIAALIVALPWVARNLDLNGTLSTPTTANMFFLTDYNDHYVYGRTLNLDHLLANQSPAQILGKRAFESAASLKIMLTTLDTALPLLVIGGALLVIAGRDRSGWRILLPAALLLVGYFVFYAWLVPYKSQGGSFKKAWLSLVPLFLPLAALALERAVADGRLRLGAMAIAVTLTGANAVDLVRLDAAAANRYLAEVRRVAEVARALPDRSGDGQIALMTQDPFIVPYVGFPAVVFPYETRDTMVAVVQRYGVDYLLLPAARPELDALLLDPALDPRFVRIAEVPGTSYVFYAVEG